MHLNTQIIIYLSFNKARSNAMINFKKFLNLNLITNYYKFFLIIFVTILIIIFLELIYCFILQRQLLHLVNF